ncbi:hypothetical protein BU26DRAFT_514076 [Trematosphaeria pertusa]|uniref:Carbohydrate-binding module family 18 protein n=1 Tax=Trematosphaeria pertusa TaxID=390896 RepID=A0A6A6J415_9PLEO|nr:uncharacterized protein BU26DRAFT_514076 [Trematosphaeria pertusa]KAF2257386.1 hypothetical protein BU26DRAFT_514076 [Trematosphaeria pertusa]
MATKAVVLLASLLAVGPAAAAGFTGCKSLDYDAFYAAKPADEFPVVGPQGLYLTNADGSCVVLDVLQAGFADAYPELYDAYTGALKIITAEAAELGVPPFKRDAPGRRAAAATCGEHCSGSWATCDGGCSCQYDFTWCAGGGPGGCVAWYKCK